ncbi:MAG: Phosphoglycerate mutase [Candidatus Kaiserbacteria bacterium GW2011_GWA2_49_19]|nr:MAG: Phosphoglycerate mutase [Candidatus Kaiserbacteria bacterium GW2011_GWA2_49_19]
MKIFMVRHGETDSNAIKRLMGQRCDDTLNDEGRRQAKELNENIAEMMFDVVFSSPLKRASETAEIIAQKRNLPVILRDELKERDYGSLSGKTHQEADAFTKGKWAELRALDLNQKYDYHPYGGESAEDVKERLLKFIDEIKREYASKRVLVVAHAGILRLSHLLFREVKVSHIDHASIEEFEI